MDDNKSLKPVADAVLALLSRMPAYLVLSLTGSASGGSFFIWNRFNRIDKILSWVGQSLLIAEGRKQY